MNTWPISKVYSSLQPSTTAPVWSIRFFDRLHGTKGNPQIPIIANEALTDSVAPSDIGGKSTPSGLPEPLPSQILSTLQEQILASPLTLIYRHSFLATCTSDVIQYWPESSVFPPAKIGNDQAGAFGRACVPAVYFLIIFTQKESETRI